MVDEEGLERSDDFDLYQYVLGQARHFNGGARRSNSPLRGQILAIDRVHRGEVVHVFQKDRSLDDLAETGPSGLKHSLQVLKNTDGLGLNASSNNLASGRIKRNLPRGIKKVSDANGLGIRADSGGSFLSRDGSFG